MDDGLLRQRRNLIAISIALLLTDFADVKVSKVTILGSELVVGQPAVLAVFAWVVWGYFLIRFHQYLADTGDLGIKDGFLKRRRQYARRFARLQPIRDGSGLVFDDVQLSRVDRLNWEVHLAHYEPATGSNAIGTRVPVSIARIQWWNLRAWCHQLTMTARLTNYALPYVLAIAAPMVHVARRLLVLVV